MIQNISEARGGRSRSWIAEVLLALVAVELATGCSAEGLTSEEHRRLTALTLVPLAPDPTNLFADDPKAAALGQQFFFDSRFSGPLTIGDDGANGGLGPSGTSGLVACSSCHDPANGGTDHRSRGNTSLGAAWTGRKAPSVLNAALAPTPWIFWDGRKDSLWSQALGPLESAKEHNFNRLGLSHLIFQVYRASYEDIFGPMPDLTQATRYPPQGKPGDPAFDSMDPAAQQDINRVFVNFGKAIEAYERKLVDSSSSFDRYMAGDESALSASAIRGAKLFVGRASCDECHSGPALADGKFHNDGVAQTGPEVPQLDLGRYAGIPTVLKDPFNAAGLFADVPHADHLAQLSPEEVDKGAFRTPTLRNVSQRAPYMHTGAVETLWDVVLFYRDAVGTDGFAGTRDPSVQPLLLSNEDVQDLVTFLRSLDGDPLPESLVHAPALPGVIP